MNYQDELLSRTKSLVMQGKSLGKTAVLIPLGDLQDLLDLAKIGGERLVKVIHPVKVKKEKEDKGA